MKIKIITMLLALSAVLRAQIAAVTPAPKVVIWTGSGIIFAPLPTGWNLAVDATGNAVLTPPAFQPPTLVDDWQQLTAAQTAFQLKCSAPVNLRIYRNGLRQHVSFDFDVTGVTVTFRAAATPQVGDTVELEYACSPTATAGTGSTKAN
jgi:hypothetical protein